jgi:hypothetical protein
MIRLVLRGNHLLAALAEGLEPRNPDKAVAYVPEDVEQGVNVRTHPTS